jgi:hypothetical protein
LPVRDIHGAPIDPDILDFSVATAVRDAIASGHHAIVHRLDSSKTGLAVPRIEALERLQAIWGSSVSVLVDACQGRCSAETMGRYTANNWPVIVTGSKFAGGPPFSGAILADRATIDAARSLGYAPGIGTLLRWTAALESWRPCAALPESTKRRLARGFFDCANQEIESHSNLVQVVAGSRDRASPASWDNEQTIATFMVGTPDGWLDLEQLKVLHKRLLRSNFACGQPVQLGPTGAGLRIAYDATRMVRDAGLEMPFADGMPTPTAVRFILRATVSLIAR